MLLHRDSNTSLMFYYIITCLRRVYWAVRGANLEHFVCNEYVFWFYIAVEDAIPMHVVHSCTQNQNNPISLEVQICADLSHIIICYKCYTPPGNLSLLRNICHNLAQGVGFGTFYKLVHIGFDTIFSHMGVASSNELVYVPVHQLEHQSKSPCWLIAAIPPSACLKVSTSVELYSEVSKFQQGT